MKFGDILKQLRKEKEMSQKELASRLSMSASAVGMYEQNRREPDFSTLQEIANFFNVSTEYLLGKSNEKTEQGSFFFFFFDNDGKDLFKKRISHILDSKGLTDDDFMEIMGYDQTKANDILHGDYQPTLQELKGIVIALNTTSDYLLGIQEEFLPILNTMESKLIDAFRQLNEDNQDIVIGEIKKYLKEQRLESVAANSSDQFKQAK